MDWEMWGIVMKAASEIGNASSSGVSLVEVYRMTLSLIISRRKELDCKEGDLVRKGRQEAGTEMACNSEQSG